MLFQQQSKGNTGMKKALKKLNKQILNAQYKLSQQEGWFCNESHFHFGKILFSKYNGLFDITWIGSTDDEFYNEEVGIKE